MRPLYHSPFQTSALKHNLLSYLTPQCSITCRCVFLLIILSIFQYSCENNSLSGKDDSDKISHSPVGKTNNIDRRTYDDLANIDESGSDAESSESWVPKEGIPWEDLEVSYSPSKNNKRLNNDVSTASSPACTADDGLRGKIYVLNIFVNEPGYKWKDTEMSRFAKKAVSALKWVEKQSKKSATDVAVDIYYNDIATLDTDTLLLVPNKNTFRDRKLANHKVLCRAIEGAMSFNASDSLVINKLAEYVASLNGSDDWDKYAVIFHSKQEGVGYAMWPPDTRQLGSYAVIFATIGSEKWYEHETLTAVYAHEFLHIYGACDEYNGLCKSCDDICCNGAKNGFCETCTPSSENKCIMGGAAQSWIYYQYYIPHIHPAAQICDFTKQAISWSNCEVRKCIDYATCDMYTTCDFCPAEPDEICDGIDNDCNGVVDDNVTCPIGMECVAGMCEKSASDDDTVSGGCISNLECAADRICVDGECVEPSSILGREGDPCVEDADCMEGLFCTDRVCLNENIDDDIADDDVSIDDDLSGDDDTTAPDDDMSYAEKYSTAFNRKDPDTTDLAPLSICAGDTATYTISFKNTGTTDWKNSGGVLSNPNYVELRSVDPSGNVVDSFLYNPSWIDKQSVATPNAASVAPSENAWFIFDGTVPENAQPGIYRIYFRPYHATGGLLDDWKNAHFTLDVKDCSQADCPNGKDCAGLECGPDPICGLSCGSCLAPPANTCSDTETRRAYEQSGVCESGKCAYDYNDYFCEYGCNSGICKECSPDCAGKECGDDGCGGDCGSCNSTPANHCLDDNTLREYDSGRRVYNILCKWDIIKQLIT